MSTIVCNIKTYQSNTIIVTSDPMIGVTGLTNFTESLVGVAGPLNFSSKSFRYTTNGVTYSGWLPLTLGAIQALVFQTTDVIIIQCAYVRNTATPVLDINNITFTITTGPIDETDTYFNTSIYAEFFTADDVEVLNWYINVVQKLYQKNTLLPNFFEVIGVDGTDKDFISFWSAIAKFFAFEVIYARKYQHFYQVQSLLQEYLEESGLKTSSQDSLSDDQYLLYHFAHQIFNRGTVHILDDETLGAPVNGELRRLLWYKPTDEFLFNLHPLHLFGWNLGNSSPCWRGLYQNKALQKVTESSQQVKVTSQIGYEISFWIQTADDVRVVVECYDASNTLVDSLNANTGASTDVAIDNQLQRSDIPIFLRTCLLASSRVVDPNNSLTDLIMDPSITSIKPRVYVNGVETILSANSPDYFRVAPLFTNYTHGLIQVPNFISGWFSNNNAHFSDPGILQYIRKYLIPYNSTLQFLEINGGGNNYNGQLTPGIQINNIPSIDCNGSLLNVNYSWQELQVGETVNLQTLVGGFWVTIGATTVGTSTVANQAGSFSISIPSNGTYQFRLYAVTSMVQSNIVSLIAACTVTTVIGDDGNIIIGDGNTIFAP